MAEAPPPQQDEYGGPPGALRYFAAMRAADPDQVPRPLIPLLLQLERPGAAQLEEAWLVSQTFGDKEDVAYAAAKVL